MPIGSSSQRSAQDKLRRSRSRRWWLPLASLGLIACQMPVEASGGSPFPTAPATMPIFSDACQAVAGYRDFRIQLERAVHSRDGAALRKLFHPSGSMRVNGIGGNAAADDWGFSRPHAASVWTELEQILKLGCAPQGKHLVLPAMATLIEEPEVSTDHLIALEAVELKSAPDETSATIRTMAPGELVYFIYRGEPGGWSKLFVDGVEAFAPNESFRSPFSFHIVLDRFEGQWRIREFTSGV